MNKIVAVDTETTGLNPYGPNGCRPFALSFTHYDGGDFYVRFDVDPFTRRVLYDRNPTQFELLRDFFSDSSITKVFHNASFDLVMLDRAGLPCSGPFYDTRILAHLADSSRPTFALKPLTKALFDYPDDDQKDLKDSVKKARREGKKLGYMLAEDVAADYALGDPELCKTYAIGDTKRTMALYKFYEPLLTNTFPVDSPYHCYRSLVEMEHALVPIAMEMSREGVCLDMKKVSELETYYSECMEKAKQARIDAGYADLNPKSPQQVIEVFYNQLHAPKQFKSRKDKKTGKRAKTLTVDKKTLAGFADKIPLAKHLLDYSEAQKQLTGFIIPFKENSFKENGEQVIHASFNTIGPLTGRFSMSQPNLQNITAEKSIGKLTSIEFRARECFVPPKDHLWVLADYSQIEIWCTAFLSKDPVMMSALLSGKKLHDITAIEVFKGNPEWPNWEAVRQKGKTANFLLQYRGGAGQLAQVLGIPYDEAIIICRRYWETYAGLDDFYKRLEKAYKRDGYVTSLFGRSFRVAFEKDSYKLGNYVSQGTAAEIMKKAMLNLDAFLKTKFPRSKLILTVHDELVQKTPNADLCDELVQGTITAMQGDFHELLGIPQPLPVEVSVARQNWASKEKYTLGA